MDENQFRWTLRNRRGFRVQSLLGEGNEVPDLLRAAARDVRRREAVEQVLPALLDADLVRRTRVVRVGDETVMLAAADGATAERLRRQAGKLARALSRKVSGIARVRVRTIALGTDHDTKEGRAWS